MGFPKQEYWRGLPFPSPGDLSNPGIKPMSPALAGGFFTMAPPGNVIIIGQYTPLPLILFEFFPCIINPHDLFSSSPPT